MPGRKAKPPRLYLRTERDGSRVWIILDRGRQIRTGCRPEETERAADALKDYIAAKHKPTIGARDPAAVAVGDVVTAYAESKEPPAHDVRAQASYSELCLRLDRIAEWWGDKTLADVKTAACEEYVKWRIAQPRRHAKSPTAKAKPISTDTARRELEDFRSTINAYHAAHMLHAVPVVTLPPKGPGRDEWLTRHQAARLLGAALGFVWDTTTSAWKRREGRLMRRDRVTRTRRRHAARFILVGLYSARREQTIRRTQWLANTTAPWLDLERMIYHGRGRDERKTKKRRPPAKIAHRLRPHLLRWYRLDQEMEARLRAAGETDALVRHVVHRPDGRPLAGKIKTGWRGILSDAGLGPEVVRHVLRHTAATWVMQQGVDLWTAAGWLGMTVETLEEKYGHHHPDFQDEAASAFGGNTERNAARQRNDSAMKWPKRA